MSNPTKKKPQERELTFRQRKAIKILSEKGGSMGSAMRKAGYSDISALTPARLTKSKGYVRILEKAGMTDDFLAKEHMQLMQSSRIEHQSFPAISRTITVKENENGRKLKKPYKEHVYRHVPDEVIKAQIEAVPGHKLMYIQKGTSEKVAYINVPENIVRKGAIEMSYKVKSHFAPDKLDIIEHELTDEDKQFLLTLNGKGNK